MTCFLSSVYSSFLRPIVRRSRTSSRSTCQHHILLQLLETLRPKAVLSQYTEECQTMSYREPAVGVVKHHLHIGRHDRMPHAFLFHAIG